VRLIADDRHDRLDLAARIEFEFQLDRFARAADNNL
jgi:hypothetical protein